MLRKDSWENIDENESQQASTIQGKTQRKGCKLPQHSFNELLVRRKIVTTQRLVKHQERVTQNCLSL
jgi:hypothetical protein